jgi:hypothetical protein
VVDAALIEKCSDPSLSMEIVEKFLAAAGSDDPLAITVRSNGRIVLIPKPTNTDQAMATVRDYVGTASVRVGLTQFPAGIGVTDVAELKPDLLDGCANLSTGTAMFAKVARIVTEWYGRPTNGELFGQMFEDAVYAWKTGNFEGSNVFRADDPGGPTFFAGKAEKPVAGRPEADSPALESGASEVNAAGIRIDLSRIGGQK